MQTIRILADDLTGALDTAGCFAGMGNTLPVIFDPARVPKTRSCAASTESRDISEAEAVERLEHFLPIFENHGGLAFKKIDSLLRGHVAAEIAHLMQRRGFHSAVIAPAFPALGRVTRNGRQWAKFAGDDHHRMVGPDLTSDFARFGIDLRLGLPGSSHARTPQVFLADAETDDDLKAVVDLGMQAGRVLWCGCAGLAEVLAGGSVSQLSLAVGRALVVCGTRHPVASLQVKQLCSSDSSALVSLQAGYDAAIAAQVINNRLRSGNWAALAADFNELSSDVARTLLGNALRDIFSQLDRPDALIVMGGDTLAICGEMLGVQNLAVRGLLGRGIPVSNFSDGEWAGMTVISKSGAFGAENTLSQIMEMIRAIRTVGNSAISQQS